MKTFYVIQEIDGLGFWSVHHRSFKGYLYADKFADKEEALKYAKKEAVGIFKITEVYDTK